MVSATEISRKRKVYRNGKAKSITILFLVLQFSFVIIAYTKSSMSSLFRCGQL